MPERAQNTSQSNQSLTQKAVKGGFWILSVKIAGRLVTFSSTLVLARLLAPSDFGVLGIALLVMALLETFSQAGFDLALIQKKGDVSQYLDTAWVFSLVRGLVLCLVLFMLAPFVASFFESPNSEEVMKVLAFCPLVRGMNNIGTIFFRKELDFAREFALQFGQVLANALVSIVLAVLMRNVFALALGLLAGNVATLCLSYVLHPYRPTINFRPECAKELFSFGKWVFGTSIIQFFVNKADNAFIGKMLGPGALGFYSIAYRMSLLPATQITTAVSQVTFPAFSKLQDNPAKLKMGYLATLQTLAFFSIPSAMMIYIFSYDFTRLFLGQKWLPSVPLIHILAFLGLCTSISSVTGPFFRAIGRPDIITKVMFVRLIIIVILIYPLTSAWGARGTAATVLISAITVDPFSIYLAARMTQNALLSVLANLIVPTINAFLIAIYVTILRSLLGPKYGIVEFCLLLVSSIPIYVLLSLLFERLFKYTTLTHLRTILRGLRTSAPAEATK